MSDQTEQLERYGLEEIKPGMVLARPIYTDQGDVLVDSGTTLTEAVIQSLKNRFKDQYLTAFIHVPRKKAPAAAGVQFIPPVPVKPEVVNTELIDQRYVDLYYAVMLEMYQLLVAQYSTGQMDIEAIGSFIATKRLNELCDGARAISQLHNMAREDDQYLLHHSLHVAILAGLMGRWLRWPAAQRERLLLAGLLHDVGKMNIPVEILNKEGTLTDEEWHSMSQHAEYSYNMLCKSGLSGEADIVNGVRQHHERDDGSGYPFGLKGDEICPFGHILAILDVYDAVSANRIYAHRRSPFDAFDIILSDIMGGKLNAEYGVIFVKHICQALIGCWVRLSDGQKGKIIYIDQSRTSALPIIKLENGEFWNVASKQGVYIQELLTYNEI